jgi:hypothetical protein
MLLLFLFNVATLWLFLFNTIIIPCLTWLLFLLDINIPYTFKYFFTTPMILLFLAPFFMLLLLFLLFQIGIPLLVFLQVWEELSKCKFFMLNLEGEIIFLKSLFVG